MSRLFYGSSNVYRNYSRSLLGSDLGLALVQCTKKAVFDTHLASLGTLQAGSVIVTSVLENFITDVCRDLSNDEVGLFANQQVTAHVEALAAALRDVPDSHACITPLLNRLDPGKFLLSHERCKIKHCIRRLFFAFLS